MPHRIVPLPRVLYIAYWGALEPLGQSLIIPTLEGLSQRGAELTALTFEKPSDLANPERQSTANRRLRTGSIHWIPLRYHKRPRLPATILDIAHGWVRGVSAGLREHAQLVHGRTFVGGLIGYAVARALRLPFVYHNEGFYPEEMVDGGFIERTSATYRIASTLEARLYRKADAIIVLSARAAQRLLASPTIVRKGTPVVVVPSCVDLNLFTMAAARRPSSPPLRLVYSGAVGGRYRLDQAARFVTKLAESVSVRLLVLTREIPSSVAALLRAGGLSDGDWEMAVVEHEQMPRVLRSQDAGLFFLARGSSEIGCSPTKIGEYWASGLPVVTTPGASDTDELIRRYRCGVVVREDSDRANAAAAMELQSLLRDPGLRTRCRAAAEEHYALAPACDRQAALYRQLYARSY